MQKRAKKSMNSKARRVLKRARVRNPHAGNEGSTGRIMTVQPYLLGNQVNVGKIPLFPARYKGTLRYADTITLSSASGVVASWVFACNGLYDPDITGTGHQPAGFDQMMLSYEHYTVIRARITATFHNNTSNATPTVAISVNAGATPVTVVNQIMEDGLVTTSRLLPAGANGCVQTIQRSCNIAVFGGVPKLLDDSSYRGTVSSNPAELSYFHLQLWNTEGATSSSAVDLVIEYESWFTEPRKLTESLSAPVRMIVMEDLVSHELSGLRVDPHEGKELPSPRYGGTSDPELSTLGSATLLEPPVQASTSLKRPIISPPRPCVQGGTNLQAGGTALIGRRPA